jgi:iron complex outermembrane receptor protein
MSKRSARAAGARPGSILSSVPAACSAVFVIATPTVPARAQDAGNETPGARIEEIIVTAQKREANLQQVPVAVSAYGAELLEDFRIENIGDFALQVPSLRVTPFLGDKATLGLFIRAVGNNDPQQPTRDPAVGVYLDGIYVARSNGLTHEIADLERIEILRGPQGALYGRNTTGGVINIVTRPPDDDFGFRQTFSVGNENYFRSLTSVDTGALGSLRLRASYLDETRDGWVENTGSGPDFNEDDKQGAMVVAEWTPSERFALDYVFDWSSIGGTPNYFQLEPAPQERLTRTVRDVNTDSFQESDYDISGHGLTLEWQLGDALTLKSLTGYREMESDTWQDFGTTLTPFVYAARNQLDHEQVSEELQLFGSLLDGRIDYIAGVYYFREEATEHATDSFVGIFDGLRRVDVENTSQSVFAQAAWSPAERWTFTLGGRYTWDEREAERQRGDSFGTPYPVESGRVDSDYFDPTAIVEYRWSELVAAYAKFTTAHRAAGFSTRSLTFDPFDPEKLDAYEIGLKTELLDRRLRLNVALYSSDFTEMQVDLVTDVTRPDAPMVFNAGESRIDGFEVDITAVPFAGLELGLNYAYTDAEYEQVIHPVTGVDETDNFQFAQPEHAFSVYATYAWVAPIGTPSATLAYSWQDDHPTIDFGSSNVYPSFGLLDARLSWREIPLGSWTVDLGLWGRNLTDEDYTLFRVQQAVAHGEPRSYGLDVRFEF